MAIDLDTLLLDRVFQPVADSVCERFSCFDLSRVALGGVVALQAAMLVRQASVDPGAAALGLVVVASLVQFWAVGRVLRQIRSAERRARPGTMNVARITLRPFRMVWLLVAAGSACLLTGLHEGAGSLCPVGANLLWVVAVYLMSCVASVPSARVGRRMVAQGAC